MSGTDVIDGIVNASRFAELDPYRAATHNKGIMNGVDAVVIATGNDWRAVEAGAHAFAARSGRYSAARRLAARRATTSRAASSCRWRSGTVGGTLRVHPAARLSLRMLGVTDAQELAAIAAAVGLASNLAAVRALATDGIQRGHMGLHARSVALAAGRRATGRAGRRHDRRGARHHARRRARGRSVVLAAESRRGAPARSTSRSEPQEVARRSRLGRDAF